ncbi:MAG: phosphohistidine phosphatase SixA [Candidatus Rokubacteria bacterium]|nr:phosphohistidine phosphatase SixA [Candidatus Rokubacteria bacterium]
MPIYLVRHGEAKPDTEDPARPLSGRGRDEIERVAREATRLSFRVAEIRHSGLLRAQQTAEILAAHLAPARGIRAVDGLRPDDDPEGIRPECEAAADPVMLVGHLPHLGRLAALLLVEDPERELIPFETGTMAALARTEGRWVVLHVLVPGPARRGG